MADKSKIEWTDATWNPITGCTKVSQGCKNCYAEGVAKRLWKGRPFEDVQVHANRLEQPFHWRKPRRVFVNSMSDLFHEAVPDRFIFQVFSVMSLCERHVFQCLTKRPKRMRDWMLSRPRDSVKPDRAVLPTELADPEISYSLPWPPPNVWLGVSVEDQATADERIPVLAETPAAVRFLSVEPILERVQIGQYLKGDGTFQEDGPFRESPGPIHWVIVGGESGPKARPCNIVWIKHIIVQCSYYGIPCFVKQLGAKPVEDGDPDDPWLAIESTDGTRPLGLHDSKGGEITGWPHHLRVREFPQEHGHAKKY